MYTVWSLVMVREPVASARGLNVPFKIFFEEISSEYQFINSIHSFMDFFIFVFYDTIENSNSFILFLASFQRPYT